ncbi:MAG: acylneuraminate cytidylyltransferase family protein [Lachnospiraceae bacterium]|nr:acylneuraminate cytidylyltransferase family protein [Lachnospiraceae bacterium]
MKKYKILAMIPARMGSRRIPKKNIRYMLDKPLIQYPIDLAIESEMFDEIWVNTESEELGNACIKMGAKFHKRPAELSGDKATNRDFVYEFFKTHDCDYIVMINPTSPTLRLDTLKQFVEYLQNNEFDTIMSVNSIKAEGFYLGEKLNFDGKDKIPSENLYPLDYIVWAMTAWKRETFIKLQESGECPVFGGNMATFSIPKDEAPDLDNEEDWAIAEAVLKARIEKNTTEIRYLDV